MKKVFIFLMLIVMSWGGVFGNLDNNISNKLDNSSSLKWQEMDKSLQKFIVTNEQKVIDNIIFNIDKPLLSASNPIIEIPKIILTRDDYEILFTYIKYLIYNNKQDRVAKIYTRVIEGLNKIDDKSIIALIFRIVIQQNTLKSLKYNISYLNKNSIKYIYSKTPNLFNLIEDDFQNSLMKEFNNNYIHGKEYKKELSKFFNSNIINKTIIGLTQLLKEYYKDIIKIYTQKDVDLFNKKYKLQEEEFFSNYSKDISYIFYILNKNIDKKLDYAKYNLSKPKDTTNQQVNIEVLTKFIFFRNIAKIAPIRLDLLKVIEFNKEVKQLLHNF